MNPNTVKLKLTVKGYFSYFLKIYVKITLVNVNPTSLTKSKLNKINPFLLALKNQIQLKFHHERKTKATLTNLVV